MSCGGTCQCSASKQSTAVAESSTIVASKHLPKPEWLKIRPPSQKDREAFGEVKQTLKDLKLTTVCEEAHCPNLSECWSSGTATFMVLGDTCTRGCRFCAIKTGKHGQEVDPMEPYKIAMAVEKWGLDYIVITSVDRDDLPDEGAGHFATCIEVAKQHRPDLKVEVLIPDFKAKHELLDKIIAAKPEVIAHNLETTRALTPRVRDQRAKFDQSLEVLRYIKEKAPQILTKTNIMLGLGEPEADVVDAMKEARSVSCDILTVSQYLQPSDRHIKLKEYVHPNVFKKYQEIGEKLGFLYVVSGPFIRSSYKAGDYYKKYVLDKK